MSEKQKQAVKDAAEIIKKWFADHEWQFEECTYPSGDVVFKAGVAADSRLFKGYDVRIVCREGDVQSLFYLPVRSTDRDYSRVVEYLMRVNYRFRLGKFTMDYRDGEIRFEVVKDFGSLKTDVENAMDDLIGYPEYVCDGFGDGVVHVITGAKSPEEAYVEADARDEIEEPDSDGDLADDDCEECPNDAIVDGVTAGGVVLPMPADEAEYSLKKSDKKGEKQAKPQQSQKNAIDNSLPRGYCLDVLNVEGKVPLGEIVNAIRRFRQEKCADFDAPRLGLLLSGVPGAGKTAFARYIANEVGAKLMTIRASDILSHLVGETEHRIEKAFAEAKREDAILFLDEIDGVVINRRFAERSFEVTQTNQLLQSIESFGGVLLAATNLVERLDEAVLRRFTYKLKLSYLTTRGKTLMFKQYFETPLTEAQQKRLDGIECVTPGDFRTVKEGLYYLVDKQNNDARLDALAAEVEAKAHPRTKIGF